MVLLILAGCVTPLADPTPYVVSPRVLAVRFEPAEVEPGGAVTLSALYADADGESPDAAVSWAHCGARKPLAEPGPVAPTCLEPDSDALAPIGEGLSLPTILPDDVCSTFGPNPPPPDEGGVAGRPVDPDVSGGYYQPVVGFDPEGGVTLGSLRARCGLANVTQELYVAWNLAYHDNANPAPEEVTLDGVALGDTPAVVPAGAEIQLSVRWPECPLTATCDDGVCSGDETAETCPGDCEVHVGCAGAETYARYDAETKALETVRETLSVAWYTTGGELPEPRGGRASDDTGTDVVTTWTTPDTPGEVWIGVVLRDDRGGVGWVGHTVLVEE